MVRTANLMWESRHTPAMKQLLHEADNYWPVTHHTDQRDRSKSHPLIVLKLQQPEFTQPEELPEELKEFEPYR